MAQSEEVTDLFTDEGYKTNKTGQVLTFEQDGKQTSYKITKKSHGRVWWRPTILYTPDEVQEIERKRLEAEKEAQKHEDILSE